MVVLELNLLDFLVSQLAVTKFTEAAFSLQQNFSATALVCYRFQYYKYYTRSLMQQIIYVLLLVQH